MAIYPRRSLCKLCMGVAFSGLLSSCSLPRGRDKNSPYTQSHAPEPFWNSKDYSGVVKFGDYQTVGKFEAGTVEHPAVSTPIPRPHQTFQDYYVSNIYSAVGLWVSALNYLLLTGEAEPLKVIDPELKTARPDIVKLYEDETGWVMSQHLSPMESPLKLDLLDPKPVETPEGSKNYLWRARLSVDASASVFYADTKESHPLADVLGLQPGEVQLQIAYVEGKWRSETAYDVVYQVS